MYNYQGQKDEGQIDIIFCKIRYKAKELLAVAGAFRIDAVLKWIDVSVDSWKILECIDKMVEWDEIKEVTDHRVAGQHRIFITVKT